MRRRRGEHAAPAPMPRPPVEATVTFRTSEPFHGLASVMLARVVRTDGSFILARGATLPDALRRAACAVEHEQALGPLDHEPRRVALAALRKLEKVSWSEDTYSDAWSAARHAMHAAIVVLEEDIRFDVDQHLERVVRSA